MFFCDPHPPWQRGSNENLNGLVRDYYPKGTDFNNVSDDAIEAKAAHLNDRAKRCRNGVQRKMRRAAALCFILSAWFRRCACR